MLTAAITRRLSETEATIRPKINVEIIKNHSPDDMVITTTTSPRSPVKINFKSPNLGHSFEFECNEVKVELTYSLPPAAAKFFIYFREIEIFIQNKVKAVLSSIENITAESHLAIKEALTDALKTKLVYLDPGLKVKTVETPSKRFGS